MAADTTSDASVAANAGLAQTEGATAAEVVASHPAADEVAAGDIAAAGASSSPAGSGDLCEAIGEATMEVPVSVKASDPPAVVAQAASILELTPSATADVPAPETEMATAVGALFFEATSDPEKVSREDHDVRMVESERSEASSPPRATTQGASGGEISRPQPGLASAARVPQASSRRNGRILPPTPDPVKASRPRVITVPWQS
jgi:hypothetical protein